MFAPSPSADDLSSQDQFEVPEAGGWDATLSGEDEDDFFDLQIVKHYDGEVSEVVLEKLPPFLDPPLLLVTCSVLIC